jgi:hypothetical protein
MIKGTTPTHIFEMSFDTSLIKEVHVLYQQKDELILTKTTEHCVINEDSISVKLTQEDTFCFEENVPVKVQVRISVEGGQVLSSVPIAVGVVECLEDGVIL